MSGPPVLRVLPEARWSCHGCGDCCTGFGFGPVRQEIIDGLEVADIASLWPPAAEAPWKAQQTGPDGEPAWFLTHREGRCVFLDDQRQCAVHRLLGAEAKPAFCREYPFLVTHSPDGPALSVRADCGGLHRTFEEGQPVTEQALEVLALPRIAPPLRWNPPHVVLLPGVAVGAETWTRLEPRLLDRIDEAERPPEGHITQLRTSLLRVLDREDAPRPSRVEASEATRAVLYALSTTLSQGLAGAPPDLPAPRRDLIAGNWRVLERALDGLDAVAIDDLELEGAPAALPLPALSARGQAYLSLVLRSRLIARRFGGNGGIPAFLGGFMLHSTVARLGADADGPLGPDELGPVLSRWLRVSQLPALQQVLRAHEAEIIELFWHTSWEEVGAEAP